MKDDTAEQGKDKQYARQTVAEALARADVQQKDPDYQYPKRPVNKDRNAEKLADR